MKDVLEAIATIRHSFLSSNLKPPTVIILESHDEGMRVLSAIRQDSNWVAVARSADLGHPIEMADGSVWMEIKIMGIAIRWPANRIATPDGSWSYV